MAKIEVEASRCKSCGLCVINCPKNIIAIGTVINQSGYAAAVQSSEEGCTGCTLCAVMCPDMAISVYR